MSLIYEPKGRAREYSALACNVYSGCGHKCIYCFAPDATFKDRPTFYTAKPRKNYLELLEKEVSKIHANGNRVLLSFTCDPYQQIDIVFQHTRETIKMLKAHGIAFQVLTKGGDLALRDIDLYTAKDAFATSLTLLDNKLSREWEPKAALPQERIDTIQEFHKAGIETWVSLEPVLNPDTALEIINNTHEFVDLYKVGKLNYHQLAKTIDWRKFAYDVVSLLDSLNKKYYIKDDLKVFLRNHEPQIMLPAF